MNSLGTINGVCIFNFIATALVEYKYNTYYFAEYMITSVILVDDYDDLLMVRY
jgi:hypothetical protein